MIWAPCQRIVRADVPPALRIRGFDARTVIYWPDAALNSAADYSIDFSALICPDDRIVAVEFATAGGQIAWSSIFGPVATAWIMWISPGLQTVTVTVRTTGGQVMTLSISVTVRDTASLMSPAPQPYAPNAFLLGSAIVPDASGNPLIFG